MGVNKMEFKLTNHEVEKIKNAYFNGEKQTDIAKRYGITQGHVSSIISGRKRQLAQDTWAESTAIFEASGC